MMGGIFDQLGGKVIAAVGIAAIAIYIGISISMTKAANIPQDLLYMSMRIQQLYSGSSDYSGLDNATAINGGAVPESLVKGNAIRHGFGGEITIAPGSGNETFTFTLTDIPKKECVTLANNQVNSWISITINGTSIDIGDVASVVNACAEDSTIMFEAQ